MTDLSKQLNKHYKKGNVQADLNIPFFVKSYVKNWRFTKEFVKYIISEDCVFFIKDIMNSFCEEERSL